MAVHLLSNHFLSLSHLVVLLYYKGDAYLHDYSSYLLAVQPRYWGLPPPASLGDGPLPLAASRWAISYFSLSAAL